MTPTRSIDVFVRDLQAKPPRSRAAPRVLPAPREHGSSGRPAISADGRFVVFHSPATNLHPDDTDDTLDVFRRDVLGPPPAPPGARAAAADQARSAVRAGAAAAA